MRKKREIRLISAAELMQMPNLTPEEEYREGYWEGHRSGWIEAIEQFHDLVFESGLTPQEAYDQLFSRWERGE